MKTSESLKNLATALVKAQALFNEPKKTKQAYNYKYAPMEECRNATIEGLTTHGLSVVQLPVTDEGKAGVSTMLLHSSGEFVGSDYMITAKQSPQDLGSLITYLRRYSYMAILGLAPEDDDGLSAMPNKQTMSQQRPAPKKPSTPTKPVSEKDLDMNKPYDLSKSNKYFGVAYKDVPTQVLQKDVTWWNTKNLDSGVQKDRVAYAAAVLKTRGA